MDDYYCACGGVASVGGGVRFWVARIDLLDHGGEGAREEIRVS